jgi:hypothetical protein
MLCNTCTTSAGNRTVKGNVKVDISPVAIPYVILHPFVAVYPHIILPFPR